MSVIKLSNFAGLVPRASARAIPGDGAQTASNLAVDTLEFRPVPADATVVANTGVTDPKTIHRLARTAAGEFNTDMSANWIVKAAEMSFAKSQLNDDTAELTYATFDDGSVAPRVYAATDLTTGRKLGVPAPTDAPTLTVNTVDEFTAEDRDAGMSGTITYIYGNANACSTVVWRGADAPTTLGYADRDGIVSGDPEEAQQVRLFRLTSTGGNFNGLIDNAYSGDVVNFGWVMDPSLGGYYQTSGDGWPGWATGMTDHWLVPFHAYGRTYSVDTAALSAALVMATPGVSGVALLTAEQITAAVAKVTEFLDWKWSTAEPKANALKAKVEEIHALLDNGLGAAAAQAQSYWASAAVTTQLATAVAAAAEEIYKAADNAHLYTDPTV